MSSSLARATRADLDRIAAEIAAEWDRPAGPRTLGDIVATLPGLGELTPNRQTTLRATAPLNALVTDPALSAPVPAFARPTVWTPPLFDAVSVVDATGAPVAPFTLEVSNEAREVPEVDDQFELGVDDPGDDRARKPESEITYTADGDARGLPTIAHTVPLTRQALRHNATLRADVDTLLGNGLRWKVEGKIAEALANAASGMATQAFDTSIGRTIRLAIAAAAEAFRELGDGPVYVLLNSTDHARLDLEVGAGLAHWPATIRSTPALPGGTAYVGRTRLAAVLYASEINVALGYVGQQLIKNTITARAEVEALAHVTAPSAIVKVTTSAGSGQGEGEG